MIRHSIFEAPEHIKNVEQLLKEKEIVINWWCRQSGKTLTNIKIATETARQKPTSILVYTLKTSSARDFIALAHRATPFEDIASYQKQQLIFKNGSYICAVSVNSDVVYCDEDLVIVDNFEWMDNKFIVDLVDNINHANRLNIFQKIALFFKKDKTLQKKKAIFSSSMKNGKIFDLLKSRTKAPVTYVNWEDLHYTDEEIKKLKAILGSHFITEYDSYKNF